MPVPLSHYVNNTEFKSRFQPKISRFAYITDDASLQCQIDLVGKEYVGVIPANLGRRTGNCVALSYPHCLPDRLAIIAYAIETGYIHDDIHYTEFIRQPRSDNAENEPQEFDPKTLFAERSKRSLSKLAANLMRIDAKMGKSVMANWEKWEQNEGFMRSKMDTYKTFDEFMGDRLEDVAAGFYTQLIRFAGNIILTDEEEALVDPIIRPLIYDATTLTNDYYSFDREYAVYLESGGKQLLANVVGFYMKAHSLSIEDAKAATMKKVLEIEEEYCRQRDDFLSRSPHLDASSPIVKLFDMSEALLSGSMLWSTTCYRYWRSAETAYIDYFNARVKEGVQFFDDCDPSDDILPGNGLRMVSK